ncbi:uncharacterized protein LOC119996693 [Tripterygium wilfordii]|uniref:uncharacterized protein LOC119996693 n=1 Tax=Tripterygium wilfordii TaxID=458696 RepID=UPI0018F8145A|nr:uncharacterized protein LOC119996693 [Tripterygium wilfordii]
MSRAELKQESVRLHYLCEQTLHDLRTNSGAVEQGLLADSVHFARNIIIYLHPAKVTEVKSFCIRAATSPPPTTLRRHGHGCNRAQSMSRNRHRSFLSRDANMRSICSNRASANIYDVVQVKYCDEERMDLHTVVVR